MQGYSIGLVMISMCFLGTSRSCLGLGIMHLIYNPACTDWSVSGVNT